METIVKRITIDGESYLLETDVTKEYIERGKVELTILDGKTILVDANCIIGIATCQLGQGYVTTKINIEYLERVIKCLKTMQVAESKNDTRRVVSLAWAKNKPVILGKRDEDKITGFLIAPVEDGDN